MQSFKEYFYQLVLEANVDKRIEFLYQKYKTKLYKLFDEHWKYFATEAMIEGLLGANAIEQLDTDKPADWESFIKNFIARVIQKIDPDQGKYTDWILKGLIGVAKYDQKNKFLGRFWEDGYKIKNDVNDWKKYKKYLLKYDNKATDLNHFDDLHHLHIVLSLAPEIKSAKRAEQEKESLKAAEKDSEKVYNSENYMIVVPKTQEASCAYGRGTRWCTAATGSNNYFHRYNNQGPLYIVIDKKTQEKYQFHFQSEQYMDAEDDRLDLDQFFDENPEMKNPLVDLALKNSAEDFALNIDPERVISSLDQLDEGALKRSVGNSAFVAVRYGLTNPEKVNAVQDIFVFEKDRCWIDTKQDWDDLAEDFIASSRGGGETEWAKNILNGDSGVWNHDNGNSYDSDYWDWLDKDSQLLIQKYILSVYNTGIQTMEEARTIVEENDDEHIKELLTYAFDDSYSSAAESKYYELAIDAITDSLGSYHKYGPNNTLRFAWDTNKLLNTVVEMKEHFNENISPHDFISKYSEYQRDEDELTIPDFDRIDSYPTKKEQGKVFNQRIQNDIQIPEQQLELSSFKQYFYENMISQNTEDDLVKAVLSIQSKMKRIANKMYRDHLDNKYSGISLGKTQLQKLRDQYAILYKNNVDTFSNNPILKDITKNLYKNGDS
jgi:hypothetical protein